MRMLRPLVLLPLLALLASCSSSQPPVPSTGSVQLAVSARQALTSANVARVTVTASAADVPAIAIELVPTEGVWGGVIGALPAGAQRTFLAQAFDASGTLRYEGKVEGVTIVAGQLTLVTLTLQALSASPPYSNEAPIIDSAVASPLVVAPGGQVALTARAHDANPGDTLAYAWTAPAGSFAAPAAASTSWTAPATPGPVVLKLVVSDSSGAASSVTLQVRVAQGQGGAVVDVGFNSPPTVTAVTSSESNLQVGQQTTLSAVATDVDGDVLRYQWSATCAGSFEGGGTATARFTPTAYPAGTCNNCQVSVAVSDGRGGQTTGTRALCVSPSVVQHLPPSIVRTYQSSLTATPAQQLTFEVVASDPEGSALSFAWSATTGTLASATPGASASRVVWTAPVCASTSAAPTVTATVTNVFGLTTTQGFEVAGLPACTSSGWTSTNSMSSARSLHTATRLANGKVLVSGGADSNYLATAEVYDPATGAWSQAGFLSAARYHHAATLLATGKVLVSGGADNTYFTVFATAEVYDPATGAWSQTGSLSSGRYEHTSTLLANGKVLVSGGISNGSQLATAEVYDPATGAWSQTGSLSAARYAHTATLLANGKVLVSGGADSDYLATAEVYDPATGAWSQTNSLSAARYHHTATLLTNGKVLVSGGAGLAYLATAEVYDPATGAWSQTGSLSSARYTHTATLLTNGKVLVTAGYNSSHHLATAEVYDPATGAWSQAGSLSSARFMHTATLLANGKVLVLGGFGDGRDPATAGALTTAEVYSP